MHAKYSISVIGTKTAKSMESTLCGKAKQHQKKKKKENWEKHIVISYFYEDFMVLRYQKPKPYEQHSMKRKRKTNANKNNKTIFCILNVFLHCQEPKRQYQYKASYMKKPKDITRILSSHCFEGVRNHHVKKHGLHPIWEYKTLRKTCHLSIFELLTYQNVKTHTEQPLWIN